MGGNHGGLISTTSRTHRLQTVHTYAPSHAVGPVDAQQARRYQGVGIWMQKRRCASTRSSYRDSGEGGGRIKAAAHLNATTLSSGCGWRNCPGREVGEGGRRGSMRRQNECSKSRSRRLLVRSGRGAACWALGCHDVLSGREPANWIEP
jgi:hypothetical protein